MKVSFVTVTYRSSGQVGDLIDSLISQETGGETETIVVDNSLTDSSEEVVRSKLPLIRYMQNERNVGFTAAINQGIREATGEFIFLLNPDIRLQPGCTQSLLNAFTRASIGAAAPQLIESDGTIQKSVRNFPRFSTLIYESTGLSRLYPRHHIFGRWRNQGFTHEELADVEQPMASALMIRKSVVDEIGPWDEQFFIFFSDVDYCRRIIDAGYKIKFVPNAKAVHLGGGSTRREGPWLIWDSHRGFRRYLHKHELTGMRKILRPFASLMLWAGGLTRVVVRKLRGKNF